MGEKTEIPGKTPDLRDLPKVDALLESAPLQPIVAEFGRRLTTAAAREVIESLRRTIKQGAGVTKEDLSYEAVAARIRADLDRLLAPTQCRVINATGVILHTSLGRAPLAPEVVSAAMREASQYSCLELNRRTGKRSHRDKLVAGLICRITGAEDATVLNNNAAATMIILNELAEGREVVCSRAHMVEIGGSFRMPDVMRKAGCKLVEIGCTNKTHADDYEEAITDQTAMLLKVHTSNYAIVGFTSEVTLAELVKIGKRRDVPVVYDLGAGSLVDLSQFGVNQEPSVPDLIATGAGLVCFSGDKLFGGPQAGIIAGRRDLIESIRKNSYYRMMRCDKVTLSLLEHTLKLYLRPETVFETVPTLRAISRTAESVREEAEVICKRLLEGGVNASLVEAKSQIGGGSTPGEYLPTTTVVIKGLGRSPDDAATRLRLGTPSVFCRIESDALVLDPRTLLPGQQNELVEAVLAVGR